MEVRRSLGLLIVLAGAALGFAGGCSRYGFDLSREETGRDGADEVPWAAGADGGDSDGAPNDAESDGDLDPADGDADSGDGDLDPGDSDTDAGDGGAPLASLCDLAPPSTPAPTANILFVDPAGNDLTGTPFATITGAATVAQPGDHIEVAAGNYGQQIITGLAGSAAAPIVIRAAPGALVQINGSGDSIDQYDGAIRASGASWVIIDGFDIRNLTGRGVSAEGVNGITLQNLTIHDTYGAAVVITGQDLVVDSCDISRALLINENAATGSIVGGAVSTNWFQVASSNVTIRRNTVHENWGIGLGLFFTDGAVISDNVVRDSYGYHLLLEHARNVRVERNVTFTTSSLFDVPGSGAAQGLMVTYQEFNPTERAPFPYPNELFVVANNIFLGGVRGIGFWCDSAYVDGNNTYRDVVVAHNVVMDAATGIDIDGACASNPEPVRLTFANNVIKNGGTTYLPNAASWTHGSSCWENATVPWGSLELPGPCPLTSATVPPGPTDFAPLPASTLTGVGTLVPEVAEDRLCRPRGINGTTVGVVE